MTTRVNVSHNVGSVVADIEDVEDDLRHEFHKRVGAAMRVVWADARQYVLDDPNVTGDLFSAIQNDSEDTADGIEFDVSVELGMAEYAAIVEFGSGKRSNLGYFKGNNPPINWPTVGSAAPVGYPYESPDIEHNEIEPWKTGPFAEFYGFTKHIEDWMRAKGVQPYTGDFFVSAASIASTIVRRGNYAHPYMRPAWFDNELKVKRAARNAVKNAVR